MNAFAAREPARYHSVVAPGENPSDDNSGLKAIADILAEELDGAIGPESTRAEPIPVQQAKLKAVYARIHALKPGRAALCLSGGGIRSASFGLGVLQEFARSGLLERFDFLSTVSGGGYVGGWLSAWIKNHPRGRDGVFEELKARPDLTLMPERGPVRHLRTYSNYLTPRLGFFSGDMWTLVATFLRNMLLNWLVLLSWLAAAMMLPRFLLAAIPLRPSPLTLDFLLGASGVLIAMAMAYALFDQPCAGDARWPQRRFLLFRQVPLALASLCITLWWAGMCNVFGQDRAAFLKTSGGIPAFCAFLICAYLVGGIVVDIVKAFSKKERPFSAVRSIVRLVSVLVTTTIGGVALWMFTIKFFPDPAGSARQYACFAPAMVLMVFLIVNFLFAGLASRVSEDEDREWWGRSAGWLLITIVAWIAGSSLVIFGPFILTWKDAVTNAVLGACGGVFGLATALIGFSAKSAAKESGQRHPLVGLLPAAAAIGFFLFLSIGISWLLDGSSALSFRVGEIYANPEESKYQAPTMDAAMPRKETAIASWTAAYRSQVARDLIFTVEMLAGGVLIGFFINPNKFSLHSVYRSRLIRAFLGASRIPGTRKPHAFTGFDKDDDFKIAELAGQRPLHIINIALNLIKGEQLAWQERRAASFTVSALHSGCWRLGYRPSEDYGAGISLGTAMAISGAAASPNMGYHSSPIMGFLMTLFNVRLGWWSGNPVRSTWRNAGPSYAAGPIFAEATGATNDTHAYVNLSDGGHFENLGLYEMVLRRCRNIVVVDAGCDAEYVFEDLGNAIRKIRIDMGVSIDIKVVAPKKAGASLSYFALGTIHYSEIDGPGMDGELLYIKPVLCGDEPADIANYASAHPEFPHEPTNDQWFSESQLESYRALGAHAVQTICRGSAAAGGLGEFFANLKKGSVTKSSLKAAEAA